MSITCAGCERKNIEHSHDDPDFCQDCFDKSEGIGIMNRADAYVTYADSYGYNEKDRKKFLFLGFMDLFHPKVSITKRIQMSREIYGR